MPRLTRRVPAYRLHKASGQAIVTFGGRDHYLGPYDSPQSKQKYDQALLDCLEARKRAAQQPETPPEPSPEVGETPDDLTVTEVLAAFWTHAQRHYRHPDGKPTGELANFRDSLRPLRRLFGDTVARGFGPKMLKEGVRQSMIDAGLCRNVINQRIGRIVHVFKWAAAEELVPVGVYHTLKTVSGLQKGRTDARESAPVRCVPDAHVDAVQPHVARQVWGMIQIQRLTGMRPGEVTMMRTDDLDTSGKVWTYSPGSHKMAYRGTERKIYIGPAAQAILIPWLKSDPAAYLFSPADARAERHAAMRAARKTAVQPSQRDRSKTTGKRRPGECYSTRTYYHAIVVACTRANVPAWHPNQLRHNAATAIRRDYGLDSARILLGHTSPATTAIYAETDQARAIEVMAEIG